MYRGREWALVLYGMPKFRSIQFVICVYSGHARRLIITSEEAISKGIRRIVAVTGAEAEKADKLAAKYQAQLNELGEEVNAAIKSGQVTEATTKVNETLKIIEVAPISG